MSEAKRPEISQELPNFLNISQGGRAMKTQSYMNDSVVTRGMAEVESESSIHLALEGAEKRLAGTYLIHELVPDDDRFYLRLVTLMADGTWISSHAHQQSRDFGFTIQQGVWQLEGPREISAKVIDFNYDPVEGDPVGITRIGFMMEWSQDYRKVCGTMYGERYQLRQNPLKTDEIPDASFGNSFTGQRVMVHDVVRY